MKVQRVFDLTENEHEINEHYLRHIAEGMRAKLTYERFTPHVPMKRLATFEFDDAMMAFTFGGIFYSEEYKS
jgi:hypothetical protein